MGVYREMNDLINKNEEERKKQQSALANFFDMLEIGQRKNFKRQCETQTDISLTVKETTLENL